MVYVRLKVEWMFDKKKKTQELQQQHKQCG